MLNVEDGYRKVEQLVKVPVEVEGRLFWQPFLG